MVIKVKSPIKKNKAKSTTKLYPEVTNPVIDSTTATLSGSGQSVDIKKIGINVLSLDVDRHNIAIPAGDMLYDVNRTTVSDSIVVPQDMIVKQIFVLLQVSDAGIGTVGTDYSGKYELQIDSNAIFGIPIIGPNANYNFADRFIFDYTTDPTILKKGTTIKLYGTLGNYSGHVAYILFGSVRIVGNYI